MTSHTGDRAPEVRLWCLKALMKKFLKSEDSKKDFSKSGDSKITFSGNYRLKKISGTCAFGKCVPEYAFQLKPCARGKTVVFEDSKKKLEI